MWEVSCHFSPVSIKSMVGVFEGCHVQIKSWIMNVRSTTSRSSVYHELLATIMNATFAWLHENVWEGGARKIMIWQPTWSDGSSLAQGYFRPFKNECISIQRSRSNWKGTMTMIRTTNEPAEERKGKIWKNMLKDAKRHRKIQVRLREKSVSRRYWKRTMTNIPNRELRTECVGLN
jgi:hypothetical protein